MTSCRTTSATCPSTSDDAEDATPLPAAGAVRRTDRWRSQQLGRYKLPPPDAVIGPVDEDGSLPRGTIRGWTLETIDKWNGARPGRGARTDLHDS